VANGRPWLTGAAYLGNSRLELIVLGIPDEIHACLFDLDGVLTVSTWPASRRPTRSWPARACSA